LKWVAYAKTPRGYFGRDSEWHVMTSTDYQNRFPYYVPIPTAKVEVLEAFKPEIEEDLKGAYRFGFKPNEINSFPNLSSKLKDLLTFHYASVGEIKRHRIARELEIWRRHLLDTGSPECQIAVFTIRLDDMRKKLVVNRKDQKLKRAYSVVFHRRRAQMTYLRKRNVRKYFELLFHFKLQDMAQWHWNTSWPC